jgi:hypothetical protein
LRTDYRNARSFSTARLGVFATSLRLKAIAVMRSGAITVLLGCVEVKSNFRHVAKGIPAVLHGNPRGE